MNAAANIFVGMSEAPLMIIPLIPKMTTSELHAVLTGGFATMAGFELDFRFAFFRSDLFDLYRICSCSVYLLWSAGQSFNSRKCDGCTWRIGICQTSSTRNSSIENNLGISSEHSSTVNRQAFLIEYLLDFSQ